MLRPLAKWRARPARLDPHRPRELTKYKEYFVESGEYFLAFLRRCRIPQPASARPPIGVVVMPWVSTPMPWYQIALGLGLLRRGRPVIFIWDDAPYPTHDLALQNTWIGKCLDLLARRGAQVVKLSAYGEAIAAPSDREQTEGLAQANLLWLTRARQPTAADLLTAEASHACLSRTLPQVRSLLQTVKLGALLVPGGVINTSGLYLLAGRQAGLRVATVDADFGVAQICTDGIAAQVADLPRAFAALWGGAPAMLNEAMDQGRAELQLRRSGRDRAGFQVVSDARAAADGSEVLIPLNVEWDASALGRHAIFADTADWVTATVAFVLEHSALRVAVRAHPSERHPLQSSQMNLAAIVQSRLGENARVRFIRADELVNSYDLLATARLVLPFVSTIGIEAAALGKTVIVSGNSHYSGLGFVWSAASRAEYFELLRRGLAGELPLKPDQVEKAWLCFYLTAVCYRVWTKFTPQPPDFWHWCGLRPMALYAEPATQHILTAIDDNIPIALVRHRWRTQAAAPAAAKRASAQLKGK